MECRTLYSAYSIPQLLMARRHISSHGNGIDLDVSRSNLQEFSGFSTMCVCPLSERLVLLVLCEGNSLWSPRKGLIMRKAFQCRDVILYCTVTSGLGLPGLINQLPIYINGTTCIRLAICFSPCNLVIQKVLFIMTEQMYAVNCFYMSVAIF